VRSERAHFLKFQGQTTIENVVFGKGRLAIHGDLRGQKRSIFKPPLDVPAIPQLCRVTTLGHIEYGAMERIHGKG
jgi:hypothetical protein